MFTHSSIPNKVLEDLLDYIRTNPILLKKDSRVILLCGAQENSTEKAKRDIFLDYAIKNLNQFLFFKAEQVFKELRKYKNNDLLSLEGSLAEYADCIVMFLESPGVFTELGAFAMNDKLAKILLLINDEKWKNCESFINLGPVAKIDKHSRFKPTIFANYSNILKIAHLIENRIVTNVKKKGEYCDLKSYNSFKQLEPKIKLLFLIDIVSIFSPVTHDELLFIYKTVFNKKADLSIELGIACATNLISNDSQYYWSNVIDKELFFSYGPIDITKLRAKIVIYFFKNNKPRMNILQSRHKWIA